MDENEADDAAPTAPAIVPAADIFEDEDGVLTRLHPNHQTQMRVEGSIAALVVSTAALVADVALPVWNGAIVIPVVIVALLLVWRMPHRRFIARGYSINDDRLRVVRGLLFRSDTVVPFGRVQHIDVDRGPLERYFGLATLTLHTAGSHNASVHLPGLAHDTALAMREEIRAHIKREVL
ncbi:PH domain-containing protein [Parerythrobacter aestuarii]|uniref:PH domain-containing protein n=1 Tax=Parerythrobacter aestuarii TaxID=3020909 RepID=UPI0024DE1118|nr:PH domain-containing protein [Parerythrobacter aestuarii]